MYRTQTSFVLGFHGCDSKIVEKILKDGESLNPSTNDYDWLGNGIYFWEQNPKKALSYAQILKESPHRGRSEITVPDVIGAVINLGNCLNLLEAESLELLEAAYFFLKEYHDKKGTPIPKNICPKGSNEKLLRKLDCAVIQMLHEMNRKKGNTPFDSVKSAFIEGDPIYETAGFHKENHIQICVINPNCIKGYFRLPAPDSKYTIP